MVVGACCKSLVLVSTYVGGVMIRMLDISIDDWDSILGNFMFIKYQIFFCYAAFRNNTELFLYQFSFLHHIQTMHTYDICTCSLYLNFVHLPAPKPNLEGKKNYSNKFFHNFHLSKSSFTCRGFRSCGLARKLYMYIIYYFLFLLVMKTIYIKLCLPYSVVNSLYFTVYASGLWFSPGTPVSSTNKTDCHDLTEILLIVALIIITLTLFHSVLKITGISYIN